MSVVLQPDQKPMDVVIQIPEGWLQMTYEEYNAHLVLKRTEHPHWLTPKQMGKATSVPARRWVEMAKRGEIPHVVMGQRTYRFDLSHVYKHLEVSAEATFAQPMRRSIRELMKSVG